jgi:hypothetical protein
MTAKCAFLGVVVLASAGFTQMAVGVTHKVTINNNCKTNPSQVIVSVKDGVSWTAHDQDYTLLFSNFPFTGITSGTPFPVPKGQTKSSGAVTDQVKNTCKDNTSHTNPACTFKYSVTGGGPTPCTNDPIVIIMK